MKRRFPTFPAVPLGSWLDLSEHRTRELESITLSRVTSTARRTFCLLPQSSRYISLVACSQYSRQASTSV